MLLPVNKYSSQITVIFSLCIVHSFLLSGFIDKTWRVYKLSPLYKFSTAPKDLKRYGQLLSSCVEAVRTNTSHILISELICQTSDSSKSWFLKVSEWTFVKWSMSQWFAITWTNKIQMAFDKLSLAFIIVIVPVVIIPNTVLLFSGQSENYDCREQCVRKSIFLCPKRVTEFKGYMYIHVDIII